MALRHRFGRSWFTLAVGALVSLQLSLQACSSDDDDDDGDAGAGTGGARAGAGAGGRSPTSGTGGQSGGSGGTTAGAGGSRAGSGGMPPAGSGGISGGAGEAGTGGTTAGTGGTMGGTAGLGGTGGMGPDPACAVMPYEHVSDFTSSTSFDGWAIAANSTPTTFSMAPVTHDATDGSPDNGSVRLEVPFSGPSETLLFAHGYATPINIQNGTVTARIKLDSGLSAMPTDVATAYLVVKSTMGYIYAAGPTVNLDRSAGWVTLTLNANAPSPMIPPGYTPCDIREIDVVVQAAAAGMFVPAVLHIDTIEISQPDGGEGGAGGMGGAGGAAGSAGSSGEAGAGGAN